MSWNSEILWLSLYPLTLNRKIFVLTFGPYALNVRKNRLSYEPRYRLIRAYYAFRMNTIVRLVIILYYHSFSESTVYVAGLQMEHCLIANTFAAHGWNISHVSLKCWVWDWKYCEWGQIHVSFFYFKCIYFGQPVSDNPNSGLANYSSEEFKLRFLAVHRIELGWAYMIILNMFIFLA